MFSYPAFEMYSADGARRVVWSMEEYEAALAEGWSEEKPAVVEPSPELIQEPAPEAPAGDLPLEAPAEDLAPKRRKAK